MTKYLVQKFFWLREKSLIQISQKTLVSLFPFFLFSGIVRVIALSVFSDRGYIHQLFSMDSWLPWDQAMRQVLINFSSFLGGLAGPLATYFAGKYIYQNQAASYTEITVTGEDAQHSDLPTNDEVVALVKEHIESQMDRRTKPNKEN